MNSYIEIFADVLRIATLQGCTKRSRVERPAPAATYPLRPHRSVPERAGAGGR
jgi:hypothetical protein